MSAKSDIDFLKIPKHIAVIMDGNGRWARKQGEQRIAGHHSGVSSVKEVAEACAELGVQYLTLYAFSTENWNRPRAEVEALMDLLVDSLRKEMKTFHDNNIRVQAIGNLSALPAHCIRELHKTMEETAGNTGLRLVLALSYSAKWEITTAVQQIAREVEQGTLAPEAISEAVIEQHLATAGFPDPELMIRTSGEHRISNFLLWQLAYAEFYFTEVLWPDFRKEHLYEALVDFQQRERRFGKTSEQLEQ